MENEQVTITLTVAQWQAVLGAVEHAPYIIVNSVGPLLAEIHVQAGQQITQFQQNAGEANATAESNPEAPQE